MARNQRRRYGTSIIVMIMIVAGLWTTIALGCSTKTVDVVSKPAASATPTASVKTSPKASPKATAKPKASPKPSVKVTASATIKPTTTPATTVSTVKPATAKTSPKASLKPSPSPAPTVTSVQKCVSPMKPQLGLDLQGGISVVMAAKGKAKADSLDKAVDIIRQRIDALGVAEPDVSRQGDNILIEIPGIKDREKALKIIGATAELRMRPVLGGIQPGSQQWLTSPPEDCLDPFPVTTDAKGNEVGGEKASTPVTVCSRAKGPDGKDLDPRQWEKLQLGPAALEGKDIAGASGQLAGGSSAATASGWEVQLKLTGAGASKFEKVTGSLACNPDGDVKRQLAIELDGKVESHPQMGTDVQCNQGITGGTAVITGNFTEKEAKDLALTLRFGALPVALVPQETNEVSPTLGRDSLKGGLLAGVIGLAVTLLYVLIFYRILGLVIWLGLSMHAGFTFAVVIILGKTAGFSLTLAGIAGLIVSIGIAADSFIVYYERIKDEVHTGKTIRSSVDRAWSSAWRTIVAADLVTALAAAALYVLAVGSVRGFALMLGLATALDLFISYLVMHPLVWLLAQTKFFNESKRLGIKRVVGDASPVLAGGAK